VECLLEEMRIKLSIVVSNLLGAKKGCHFQAVFRRLLPRLGYKSSIWVFAHRLCHLEDRA
jgi:hypothetical protein